MKKILLLLLAAVTAICAVSCGNEPAKQANDTAAPAQITEDGTAADAGTVPPPADETDPAAGDTGSAEDVTEAPAEDESVVIDDEGFLIRVTDLTNDELWGPTVGVYCENRKEFSSLNVVIDGASVDGVQADAAFSCEIAPGKNKSDSVILTVPEALSGVEYTDVELRFRVYDLGSAFSAPAAEAEHHIYPQGKEAASVYTRAPQDGDIVIADNDSLSVTITGFGRDSLYDCIVNLFIVNKTGRDFDLCASDVKLNGKDCDPAFSATIRGGMSLFRSIGWPQSLVSEQGVGEVSDVSLTFTVTEAGDPEAVAASESVTFDVPAENGGD